MGVLRRALGARPVLEQTWNDLLFAHWPLPPSALRPLLPRGLALDTYEGKAWIGLTSFILSGLRLRGLPPLPGMSRFAELNLRTYVVRDGRPGIAFFSLEAGNAWAVALARLAFHLPYRKARVELRKAGGRFEVSSRRASAVFAASYAPSGPPFAARPGSLEHWLTERYRFFTPGPGGVLWRGEVRHPPWILREARGEIRENTLAAAAGIRLPAAPPLLHYSKGVRVDVWPLVADLTRTA